MHRVVEDVAGDGEQVDALAVHLEDAANKCLLWAAEATPFTNGTNAHARGDPLLMMFISQRHHHKDSPHPHVTFILRTRAVSDECCPDQQRDIALPLDHSLPHPHPTPSHCNE